MDELEDKWPAGDDTIVDYDRILVLDAGKVSVTV